MFWKGWKTKMEKERNSGVEGKKRWALKVRSYLVLSYAGPCQWQLLLSCCRNDLSLLWTHWRDAVRSKAALTGENTLVQASGVYNVPSSPGTMTTCSGCINRAKCGDLLSVHLCFSNANFTPLLVGSESKPGVSREQEEDRWEGVGISG